MFSWQSYQESFSRIRLKCVLSAFKGVVSVFTQWVRVPISHILCWVIFSNCLLCVRALYHGIEVFKEQNRHGPCFPGIYSLAVETDIEWLCLQIFNLNGKCYKGVILKAMSTCQRELEVNSLASHTIENLCLWLRIFLSIANLVKQTLVVINCGMLGKPLEMQISCPLNWKCLDFWLKSYL